MNPVPERVQKVLDNYFHLLDSKQLNFLEAYYIYGSISGSMHYDPFQKDGTKSLTNR
jgi:hypothetical protein